MTIDGMTRTRSRRRVLAAGALVAAIGVFAVGCAGGDGDELTPTETPTETTDLSQAPGVVPLPEGFQPEGVTASTDGRVFVGSLRDGDVWEADLDSGGGSLLVDAPADRVAVGLDVDEANGRLFVAGGPTGHAFVYDIGTGDDVAAVPLTTSEGTFVNDVVVTPSGAWFTDSQQPVLYHVPFTDDGSLGTLETLELQGPAGDASADFNLNGIDAVPDGSTLVVVHSGLGEVLTVDPETGESSVIDLGEEGPVPNGDGILLAGSTLWVVQNFLNQIAEIALADDLATGTIESVVTDERFRIPTTIAAVEDRLVVVNARFDIAEPSETDEYELVVLTP